MNKHCPYLALLMSCSEVTIFNVARPVARARDETIRAEIWIKPYAKIGFTGITCSIEKPLRQATQGVKQTVIWSKTRTRFTPWPWCNQARRSHNRLQPISHPFISVVWILSPVYTTTFLHCTRLNLASVSKICGPAPFPKTDECRV